MGQEMFRLKVTPFDSQNHDVGFTAYYLDSYAQMVFRGRDLYLRSFREPQMARIDTDTLEGSLIGSKGEGPGELRGGVLCMEARGPNLWAVDSGRRNKILHFVDGRFKGELTIEAMDPIAPNDGLSLAASDTHIMAPVSPRTGHLAMAYGHDGSKIPVGKIPFDKRDGELVYRLPYVNQTIWHYGGDGHWYAAFPYAAMIFKFNSRFEQVAHFTFESPVLAKHINRIHEFEPKNIRQICIPLVSDLKWFRGNLYIMSSGYLFQMEPEKGTLLSISRFSVNKPEDSGPGLKNFPIFAFREDGTLFLGHPNSYDISGHDMHQLRQPPFLQLSKGSGEM